MNFLFLKTKIFLVSGTSSDKNLMTTCSLFSIHFCEGWNMPILLSDLPPSNLNDPCHIHFQLIGM